MKLTILLILTFSLLKAPNVVTGYIAIEEGINPYKVIINAIGAVESNFDTLAYNPKEEATGFFQCRPIRLKDYNQRTGESLTLEDMYNYPKAERVFLYYATQFRHDDYKAISIDWNKSRTLKYWKKVQKYLK